MDAIDALVAPVKPTLRTLTTSLPRPLDKLALDLLGPQCHASLMQRLDFSSNNDACLKLALSKALGTAIISAASIVKVPQLIKLASSQSAAGLSFTSYLLETASFGITLAYSVRNGFPFSTFGETAFIAVQDVAIGALILLYSGRSAGAAAFVAVVAAAVYALFVPEVVAMGSLKYLQAGAGILGVASKIPQILTVYQEGGTGQLSAFAVCFQSYFILVSLIADLIIGLQLPRRLSFPYLHDPAGSRRPSHTLRLHLWLHPECHPCRTDDLLLEQPSVHPEDN